MPLTVPSPSANFVLVDCTNLRLRHRKELQVKAMLRLDDLHWRKYGRPSPAAEKRDFPEELQWFQEERWSERMPAHLRARRQQSGEML